MIQFNYPPGNDHISHQSPKRKIIDSKVLTGRDGIWDSSQEGQIFFEMGWNDQPPNPTPGVMKDLSELIIATFSCRLGKHQMVV